MPETFYKYISCKDCEQQWRTYCPICKQIGNKWKDENGKNVPAHQLTEKSRNILKWTKGYKAVIEDRIINHPVPLKIKKKIVLKEKTKKETEAPIQPLPITWENFFMATKGIFDEIDYIPYGFESFYKSKGSEYFINEDKTQLVRKSNHWGYGIKYCNWYLKGYGFRYCASWSKLVDNPLKTGIIKIGNLKPIIKKKKKYQHQEFIPTQFDL